MYRFLNNLYCKCQTVVNQKHVRNSLRRRGKFAVNFCVEVRYSLLMHSSSLVEKRAFLGGGGWGVLLDCFVVVVDSLIEN